MAESTEFYKPLQELLSQLEQMLQSDAAIEEEAFCKVVGLYSKELKVLLRTYFEVDAAKKDELRPWINYYRQLQHYLVYLIRYSEILQVPHHSEILQTLAFIENQDRLIQNVYVAVSEAQKQLFSKEFLNKLDELLEEKLRKL